MNPAVENFWQAFQGSLPPGSEYAGRTYLAESWGDNPALADELGDLIVQGLKTATCSAVWAWEAEGNPPTPPGTLTVVLDGRGEPLCIVETIEITIRPYNSVDDAFAFDEGEEDRSLASWRAAHKRYFTRTLASIGQAFSPDMPLVCERFRKIYP